MLKVWIQLIIVSIVLSVEKSVAQGCLLMNYDPYNKVFNVPSAPGSKVFLAGNGRNFVWWQGVCGPHTYVMTTSNPSGTCTVQGVTQTGTYYPTVSAPFTSPCPIPLDGYVWGLMGAVSGGFYFFTKKSNDNAL